MVRSSLSKNARDCLALAIGWKRYDFLRIRVMTPSKGEPF